MAYRTTFRSTTACCVIALVFSLVSSQSAWSEDLGISECVETQEDKISLIIQLISDCVIEPDSVNLHDLAEVIGENSAPEFISQLLEIHAQTRRSSLEPATRMFPTTIRRFGDGFVANAVVECQAGPAILLDTISFVFETSVGSLSSGIEGPKLIRLDRSAEELRDFAARSKELVSNSRSREPSATWYNPPLLIADSTSPNLLIQKYLFVDNDDHDNDINVLSTTTSASVLDTRLFDRPYASTAFRYIDPLKSFDLLVTTDANWDRIIVSGLYGEDLENRILSAYCSSGSGQWGLRSPTGISWAGWQFWVADAYNDRVVQFRVNTSNEPPDVSWQASYDTINASTGDCLLNPIDVTANTFYVNGGAYARFAILDQGHNRVVIHDEHGYYSRSDLGLSRPTAICMGRNVVLKTPSMRIYVADAGNNRVVWFNGGRPIEGVWDMVHSTPAGMFPEDAYLSSVESDNYGGIYVLDAANSVIFKLSADLASIESKFGTSGSGRGQLLHPSRLAMTRGSNYVNHTLVPQAIGEAITTEYFGPATGVRRYSLGFDVLAREASYRPKYDTYPIDFLNYRYLVTGLHHSRLRITVAGTVEYDSDESLRRPGELQFSPYQIPEEYPDILTCVFRLDVHSAYAKSTSAEWQDTSYVDTLVITRRTDVPPCSETVDCRIRIDSTRFLSPDGCVYVDGYRWYHASVFWYDACTGEETPVGPGISYLWKSRNLPLAQFCSDTALSFVYYNDSIETFSPSVYVRFPSWPSTWPLGLVDNMTLCQTTVRAFGTAGTGSPARSSPISGILSPEDVLHCGRASFVGSIAPNCSYADCCPDPPDPPDPGCPFLYTWYGDKFGYRFVNNLLPQSEGLTDLDADALDYYPILMTSPIDTFYYKFLITEEEKEVSKIDQFELQAFDIPYRRGTLKFNDQQELIYLTDSLTPSSAITDKGLDVTDLLAQREGKYFESVDPGWVDFTYDLSRTQLSSSLSPEVIDPPVIDPEPPGKDGPPEKIAGDATSVKAGIYTLSVQDETGGWQPIGTVYPRIRAERKYLSIPVSAVKNQVRLRLTWSSRVKLDGLNFYTTSKQEVTPVKLSLVSARHSGSGLVQSRLNTADGLRQVLMPGDSIELTYYAPPADNMRRVFMFAAKGKYRTLTERELAQLTEDPVTDYEFGQNYPNPFNPVTTFNFGLPQTAHVTLEVYNIIGQKVATLTDREYPPGRHSVDWDTRQASGAELASGVYFARLKAGDYTATRKMVVVK